MEEEREEILLDLSQMRDRVSKLEEIFAKLAKRFKLNNPRPLQQTTRNYGIVSNERQNDDRSPSPTAGSGSGVGVVSPESTASTGIHGENSNLYQLGTSGNFSVNCHTEPRDEEGQFFMEEIYDPTPTQISAGELLIGEGDNFQYISEYCDSGNIPAVCATEVVEEKYNPPQISTGENANDTIPPPPSPNCPNGSIASTVIFTSKSKNTENEASNEQNEQEAVRRSKRKSKNKPTTATSNLSTKRQNQDKQPRPKRNIPTPLTQNHFLKEPVRRSKSKNKSIGTSALLTERQNQGQRPKRKNVIPPSRCNQFVFFKQSQIQRQNQDKQSRPKRKNKSAPPQFPFVSLKRLSLSEIRRFAKKPRWICPHCPKTFSQRAWLKAHLKCHSGERPFPCLHCPYAAATKGVLETHLNNIHLKTKLPKPPKKPLYKCNLCQEEIKRKMDCTNHEKTHGGYQCYFCPYRCKDLTTSLVAHLRMHTNETPFKCQSCPFTTKTSGDLQRHLKKSHGKK